MTDRERLIDLAKQIDSAEKRLTSLGRGITDQSAELYGIVQSARDILAELDPKPRELWGGLPVIVQCADGTWSLSRSPSIDRVLHVYGPTRADAIRRYNAAAEAIERSDREAGK